MIEWLMDRYRGTLGLFGWLVMRGDVRWLRREYGRRINAWHGYSDANAMEGCAHQFEPEHLGGSVWVEVCSKCHAWTVR